MTGHPLADRIVGVDVGGTKTHLAALDTSGVRRDVIEPSSRWRNGHLFSEPGNLPRLAGWLSSVTALDPATRIVIGLRDCDTDADLDRARRAVRDALGLPVRIENDADLLAPASGDGPAIAMIVGTGSIISARTAAGQRVTADGYGWLVGDWASGPGLVREAIGRVLEAADRDDADPLAGELFDHFGVRDAASLATVATIEASPERWGAAAPRVFEAAAQASALAHGVIGSAARRLASGVDAVRRRGGLGDRVVAAGGVIVHQPALYEAVEAHLAQLASPLPLQLLTVAPVEGALALAGAHQWNSGMTR